MATMAQEWIQQGEQNAKRTIAEKLLSAMNNQQISEVTGLPLTEVEQIRLKKQD